jgi:hypothetical protein
MQAIYECSIIKYEKVSKIEEVVKFEWTPETRGAERWARKPKNKHSIHLFLQEQSKLEKIMADEKRQYDINTFLSSTGPQVQERFRKINPESVPSLNTTYRLADPKFNDKRSQGEIPFKISKVKKDEMEENNMAHYVWSFLNRNLILSDYSQLKVDGFEIVDEKLGLVKNDWGKYAMLSFDDRAKFNNKDIENGKVFVISKDGVKTAPDHQLAPNSVAPTSMVYHTPFTDANLKNVIEMNKIGLSDQAAISSRGGITFVLLHPIANKIYGLNSTSHQKVEDIIQLAKEMPQLFEGLETLVLCCDGGAEGRLDSERTAFYFFKRLGDYLKLRFPTIKNIVMMNTPAGQSRLSPIERSMVAIFHGMVGSAPRILSVEACKQIMNDDDIIAGTGIGKDTPNVENSSKVYQQYLNLRKNEMLRNSIGENLKRKLNDFKLKHGEEKIVNGISPSIPVNSSIQVNYPLPSSHLNEGDPIT